MCTVIVLVVCSGVVVGDVVVVDVMVGSLAIAWSLLLAFSFIFCNSGDKHSLNYIRT